MGMHNNHWMREIRMQKHGVYKIVNKINGKYYVGRTTNIVKRFSRHIKELRKNIHHCIFLQRAWNKYKEENFDFLIIQQKLTLENAIKLEKYYLDNFHLLLYNTSRIPGGGDLISYHPNKEEIVRRMTNSLRDRYDKLSDEERKRIYGNKGKENNMFGRTHTLEARNIIISKLKKYYENNSSYRKGKTFIEVHGEEEAKRLKNILSEKAKAKTGAKNPFYGKSHSDKTKQLLSTKMKGKIPANARSVIIDGKEYRSCTEASRDLKVVPATILHRIKSHNPIFKGYFYKDQLE
jgi:group I intron endonuclease